MLLVAFSFIYISWIFISLGWAFQKLFGKLFDGNTLSVIAQYYFSGFAIAGLTCLALWIVTPLQSFIHFPIIIAALVSNFYSYKHFSKKRNLFKFSFSIRNGIMAFFFLLTSLAVCMKAAAPSLWFDHGLYYIQTIKWMQNYPMILGLANIHNRLGFASALHAVQALFSQNWVEGASFDDLNELALFWFIIGFSGRFIAQVEKLTMDWFSFALILFVPFICLEFLSSPSVDSLLILVTLFMVLSSIEKTPNFNFIWLLAAFGIACKLSGVIILIIPFVLAWRLWPEFKWKTLSGFWILPLAGIIVLTKNIILTGYPFFTFPLFGLEVDWALPLDKVLETNQEVIGHARIKLGYSELAKGINYKQVAEMNLKEWLPVWWSQRPADHILLIFVLIISVFFWLWKSIQKNVKTIADWLAIGCIISLAYWFFTAPEPRFQYGLLLSLPALTLFVCLKKKLSDQLLNVSFIILASFGLLFLVKARDKRVLMEYLIKPAKWNETRTGQYTIKPGIHIKFPLPEKAGSFSSGQCWDSNIPCSPYELKWLECRGNQIEDGFRINPQKEN